MPRATRPHAKPGWQKPPLGRNAKIAAHGELDTAAETVTVHQADDDLLEGLQVGDRGVPFLRECAIRSPSVAMSLHIQSRAPVLAG